MTETTWCSAEPVPATLMKAAQLKPSEAPRHDKLRAEYETIRSRFEHADHIKEARANMKSSLRSLAYWTALAVGVLAAATASSWPISGYDLPATMYALAAIILIPAVLQIAASVSEVRLWRRQRNCYANPNAYRPNCAR